MGDAASLEEALAFLESLSKALFPAGVPEGRGELTWADREEVAGLHDDGRIRRSRSACAPPKSASARSSSRSPP
jgi:hypothetical protein